MIKILNYLKEQYLAVIITVIWIFCTLHSQKENSILLEKNKHLETVIKDLSEKDHAYAKAIDSLAKIDTIIETRIKIIKQKEYVQIKAIDGVSTSELQRYFTDRYKEK